MNITIELIDISQKEILRDLLKDYLIEIHQGGDGNFPWLDSYWQNPNRYPYFIKADDQIAGFALVNQHSLIQPNSKNLSEFYIKPEFRKTGIGRLAAFKIWDQFPGKWEGRQIKENPKAHDFWLKTKGEYTHGNLTDVFWDNDQWSGWIQTFDSSKSNNN
jgi:predicted acetyltransferase